MVIQKMVAGKLWNIHTTTCPLCYGEGGDGEQHGHEMEWHICPQCNGMGTIQHRREVRDDS